LFDEAEQDAEGLLSPDADADDEAIRVAAHQCKKRGRKPIADHLPCIDVMHEIPECERRCDHDGRLLTEIGEVISEQLDIVPATIRVLRHIRKKYACGCCAAVRRSTR
jgi:transposase